MMMKPRFIIVFAFAAASFGRLYACDTTLAYLETQLPHYPWSYGSEYNRFLTTSSLINDYIAIGGEAARQDIIHTDVGKVLRELKEKGIKPSEKIAELIKQKKAFKEAMNAMAKTVLQNYEEPFGQKLIDDINNNVQLADYPGQFPLRYIFARLHYIKCRETIIQLACLASSQP